MPWVNAIMLEVKLFILRLSSIERLIGVFKLIMSNRVSLSWAEA
uniref:Zpu1 n=1 Tax=Arundo donax TaxID=35708 RepID=A0A0A9DIJ3_ARUDO